MKTALVATLLLLAAQAVPAQVPIATPSPAPAAKAQRLALVIGNAAYKDAPLVNPINDAVDIAKALEANGFTVIKRENASLREMHLALREFGDKLGRQATGLVYFSGHGLQVRGRNYLLPVDADIQREDEVAFAALDLGAVMEKLDSAKNPVNFVILDACRNNPFGTRIAPTAKGLAQVDAPPGTLIAFSTAPGSTAADGSGRNGRYTQYLLTQIGQPGLGIEDVFKSVRASVRTESKNQQIPWESTSLETAFYFRAAPPPAPVKVAAKPPEAAKAAKGESPKRSLPATVGAPPNFVVGDTWTYRIVNELDGGERRTTTRVTKITGDTVEYSNGNVSDIVGNNRRIQRGDRVEVHTPSAQSYVFPLVAGGKWSLTSSQETGGRTYDLVTDLAVGGEEDVETPAGKFRAIKITRVAKWKQRETRNDGVNTWTYWYSSLVKRFVAGEQSNVTAAGKVLLRERMELVAYDVK
ncbi:hypothetical protein BWI17_09320 [Betaproteobacteria bacterium GR16-43]|nr:hypothetical protein BWI17_09320 [Betaproteobacteria bacterium GR16-43]